MAQQASHIVNQYHCLAYIPVFFNLEIFGNYDSVEEISLKTGNYVHNSVAAVSQTMSCN